MITDLTFRAPYSFPRSSEDQIIVNVTMGFLLAWKDNIVKWQIFQTPFLAASAASGGT